MGKNPHLAVWSETQDWHQGFNVKVELMSILVPCMITQRVNLHSCSFLISG